MSRLEVDEPGNDLVLREVENELIMWKEGHEGSELEQKDYGF